jgi:hypothetical protein
MVATGDLKSPVFGRAGSTPATRTMPWWWNWQTHYVEVVGVAGSNPA